MKAIVTGGAGFMRTPTSEVGFAVEGLRFKFFETLLSHFY